MQERAFDVSVVIPVYNREKNIQFAIDSVLQQRFAGSVEIIVVDDGSTDRTVELVQQKYSDNVILLLKEKNDCSQGASSARNRGIKNAHGRYICFLDSDDFYKENFIKELFTVLETNESIGYAFCRIDKAVKTEEGVFESAWTVKKLNHLQKTYHVLYGACCIHTIGVMIRKSLLNSVGFFNTDLKIGEDTDMWLRISEISPGLFVDFVGAVYCINGFCQNQLTTNVFGKNDYNKQIFYDALYRYTSRGDRDRMRLFLICRNLYMLNSVRKIGFLYTLYRQISVSLKLFIRFPICLLKYWRVRIYG